MKKILKLLLETTIVFGLMSLFLNMANVAAFAASYLDIGGKEIYSGANIPDPGEKSGQAIVVSAVLGGLVYVKAFTVVVGILYISILGLRLILSSGNEEDITTARRGIIYALIAFVIISMSQELAKIFDMSEEGLLNSPQNILKRVHIFDKQIEIFMTFIKYMIGGFASVMVIKSAIKLITSGGEEEEVSKNKKGIMYSAGGLILIYVGDIFINKVFYKVDKNVYSGITGVSPTVDVKAGVEEIAGVTNFIVSFIAPIAILMLLGGAIMYATSGGEEEQMTKAKRIIMASVIGIVIIYGSFALVSTVISSRLTEIGALPLE